MNEIIDIHTYSDIGLQNPTLTLTGISDNKVRIFPAVQLQLFLLKFSSFQSLPLKINKSRQIISLLLRVPEDKQDLTFLLKYLLGKELFINFIFWPGKCKHLPVYGHTRQVRHIHLCKGKMTDSFEVVEQQTGIDRQQQKPQPTG